MMNFRYSHCDTCGAPGHNAFHCPLRRTQEKQDPFGGRTRPKVAAISDPATRDADRFTLFLNSPSRDEVSGEVRKNETPSRVA